VTHDVRVAARTDRVLLMMDGRLAAEKRLGRAPRPVPAEELKSREEVLSQWLMEMEDGV
jgi:putative ABC transport system ATP-binding protein